MEIKDNFYKPRWKKVLTDLWDYKLRTILVVVSIAVGVFAVGTIVTSYVILAEDIPVQYAARNPTNIDIYTDPFYDDFVRMIEHIPGVLDAEGRRIIQVRASKDGKHWQKIKLIGVSNFEDLKVNLLKALQGTTIPDRRELVVSDDFLNSTGFKVGDVIEIELPDGRTNFLPLVGLVSDQVTNGSDFLGGASGYITLDTFEWLGLGNSFNRLLVRVDGNSNNEGRIRAIAGVVEEKTQHNNRQIYRTRIQLTNNHPLSSIVLALLGVLAALGGLILVLSSSLIVNTMNALLTQHLRQIGVMKLVGARSIQILAMYLILILSYGVVALILALPSSSVVGFAFAKFITRFINAEIQGFRVIPLAIILQVFISLLIPLAAGYLPVNNGSKTNVRSAISNDRQDSNSTVTNSFKWITNRLSWIARPILLSLRNTFRRKGRLVLTIFTLTVAGGIFIAVFNVRSSMSHFMEQINQHFQADITLSFSKPYPVSRIKKLVLSIPGVIDLEGWGATSVDVLDEADNVLDTIQIMAPPPETQLVDPEIVAGRWVVPGERKALVVSDTIYDIYPALNPGDTLRIDTPKARKEDWSIVGVFRFTGDMDDVLAYADYNFISDLVDLPNQAMTFRIITSDHSVEGQTQIEQAIDESLRERDFLVNEVEIGSFTQGQTTKGINVLIIFLVVMALLTALVGSIGLTGTMGMNVMERTREIGVMRAIGAMDQEIIKSVVIEGGFVGVITWFFAILLSFPISHVLLRIVSESMMGSPMELTITYQGSLIWLGAVLILSVVASILPGRNAARLTIREVLAYE